ncbi:hypothetical protein FRB94_002800 [Tulasnella sp. JGI-2019a]|nr:hypothetical protein FRB94_002800 [Tulasnella sp. JGI-2019a]
MWSIAEHCLYTDIVIPADKRGRINKLLQTLSIRQDLATKISSFEGSLLYEEYQGTGGKARHKKEEKEKQRRRDLYLHLADTLAAMLDHMPNLHALQLHDLDWNWSSHLRLARKAAFHPSLKSLAINGVISRCGAGAECELYAGLHHEGPGNILSSCPWDVHWPTSEEVSRPISISEHEEEAAPKINRALKLKVVLCMRCFVLTDFWKNLMAPLNPIKELEIRCREYDDTQILPVILDQVSLYVEGLELMSLVGFRTANICDVSQDMARTRYDISLTPALMGSKLSLCLPLLKSLRTLSLRPFHLEGVRAVTKEAAHLKSLCPSLENICFLL